VIGHEAWLRHSERSDWPHLTRHGHVSPLVGSTGLVTVWVRAGSVLLPSRKAAPFFFLPGCLCCIPHSYPQNLCLISCDRGRSGNNGDDNSVRFQIRSDILTGRSVVCIWKGGEKTQTKERSEPQIGDTAFLREQPRPILARAMVN